MCTIMNRIGFDLDFKHLNDSEPRLTPKVLLEKLMDVAVCYNADLEVCRSKNGYHFKMYMQEEVTRELDLAIRAAYDSDGRLFWAEERGKNYSHGWIGYLDILHGRNYKPNKDSYGGEGKHITIVRKGIVDLWNFSQLNYSL